MAGATRRDFLETVSAGTLACSLTAPASAHGAIERVRVGIIGPGGMGSNHVAHLVKRKDVEILAVCDPDSRRAAKAADQVAAAGHRPDVSGDLRRVLDNPAIDAVFVATPDHWHAPASILALDAGKHVYVEKPCCHNIREGRLMAEAVARSRRRLQVGTQSRSTDCVMEAMQRIAEGAIGRVLVAKAWNSQRRRSIGRTEPGTPPEYLDFDMWTGPAPAVPYRSNMLPGIWRWWHNFGCGDIGNDGVHDIDVALWGLGVSKHPERATCIGTKLFFDDDQEFPDTQYAVFDYGADTAGGPRRQLIFEQRIWSPYVQEGYENGAAFYGTEGQMIIGHTVGWKLFGPRNQLVAERTGRADLKAHHDNFFNCIRGGEDRLNADITAGHLSAAIVHLANIAARTGRLLRFDPENEQIGGDPEANELVRRRYRDDHWAVPAGV